MKTKKPLLVMVVVKLTTPLLFISKIATADCLISIDNLTTNCSGNISPLNASDTGKSISIFDAAANPNPPWSTDKYNPNPPTVTINLESNAIIKFINPSTSNLFDKAIIGANFPNNEDPAVNNWILNTQKGSQILLSSASLSSGQKAVISDSQVNTFTINNQGVINVAQTYFNSHVFDQANLNTSYNSIGLFNIAKYLNGALNPISAINVDDNTNSFQLNNNGEVSANGHFASPIYGRTSDQTIVNNSHSLISNKDWVTNDTFTAGHWAIVNYGGADFATIDGSNPDTPLYIVTNNNGLNTINVEADSQTVLKNIGQIKGDILMLDSDPLTMSAAIAHNTNLPVANLGENSGPRDSNINNSGLIEGNFYLGSGNHNLVNNGIINGNINIDQSPSLGSFTIGNLFNNASSSNGPWLSVGSSTVDPNSNLACPNLNAATLDPYCAQSHNELVNFVGNRKVNLQNLGNINGNVTITNTTAASHITIGNGITSSGVGSSLNAPSTVTAIQGILFKSGSASAANIYLQPIIQTTIKNHSWFEVANNVSGGVITSSNVSQLAASADTGLVNWTAAINNHNNLVVEATIKDANNLTGISQSAANIVNSLNNYNGNNNQLQALDSQILSQTSVSAARSVAEQLRPEINAATPQTILSASNNLMRILDNHLTEGNLSSVLGADYTTTRESNPITPVSYQRAPTNGFIKTDYNPNQTLTSFNNNSLKADNLIAQYTPGFWLQGITQYQQQGTRQGIDGYQGHTNGFALGFDTRLGNREQWTVGALFSTSRSNIDASGINTGNSSSINSNQGFLYTSWRPGKVYINSIIGVGGNDITGNRNVLYQGISSTSSAMHYSGRIDAGLPLQTSVATLIPTAYFAYNRINQSGYTETGGSAALHINASDFNSACTGLGGKAVIPLYQGSLPWTQGIVKGSLEVSALWSHEFANTASNVSANFAAASDSPTVYLPGKGAGRDSGLFGAGTRLNFAETEGIKPSVLLNYFAEIKDEYLSNTGMVQGRIDF